MKITDVKVIPVNKFLFVKVFTDEGITGLGESGDWGFLLSSGEVIESFREYLIGKNPMDIEHHWEYMYRCFHFRGAAVMGALSAIDIALYDIKGKALGVPVYQLLGGKCRQDPGLSHVSERASGSYWTTVWQKGRDLPPGHLSPSWTSPPEPYFETYASMISGGAERIGKIREALGNDVDLCIENHRRMNPAQAIALAQQLEPFLPMFYEDPLIPDNFDAMALVASKIRIPLATGERIHTPQEYEMLVRRCGVDYLRVSIGLCGGFTGAKKISAIAEANQLGIIPHNPLSPVATAACIQMDAATPCFTIQEYLTPTIRRHTPGLSMIRPTHPYSAPAIS
ncbi:MAG: mandelate racemase/muconate lactonizing enzyme family protein [Hydrogeniiclostridium mannosilyticum]